MNDNKANRSPEQSREQSENVLESGKSVPPGPVSAPPFFVYSISQSIKRNRAEKKGRIYKTNPWLFSGPREKCLEFIAKLEKKHGPAIHDDILITTKKGKEEKWSIKELPKIP